MLELDGEGRELEGRKLFSSSKYVKDIFGLSAGGDKALVLWYVFCFGLSCELWCDLHAEVSNQISTASGRTIRALHYNTNCKFRFVQHDARWSFCARFWVGIKAPMAIADDNQCQGMSLSLLASFSRNLELAHLVDLHVNARCKTMIHSRGFHIRLVNDLTIMDEHICTSFLWPSYESVRYGWCAGFSN